MSRLRAALIAALLAGVTIGLGYAVSAVDGTSDAGAAVGPGIVTVRVGINHSHFDLNDLHVRAGTLVRFVVHNDDPIDHEFVVGDDAVHAQHEHGHEATHPPVPGEVSIGPGETGETTYTFATPGAITYACHLPRHIAYGMAGTITVDAAR